MRACIAIAVLIGAAGIGSAGAADYGAGGYATGGVRAPGDCDHLFQLIATRRSD